ncbi:MAG: fur [Rariglobus sp.]|jgi:Fur family ferric uptake transcriptional regulator|nr:fur [Rariglobus sp.]
MATRSPEDIEAFCRRAQDHWSKDGRRTQVRDILSRVVAAQAAPFSADELRTQARRIDRGISYASIYRTLGSLVEAGLLREIVGPNDRRCYTLIDSTHTGVSHIVCTDCEQVVPMNDDCLPLREGFLARQLGFTPRKMSLRIEASCEELRQHGACARRKQKEP